LDLVVDGEFVADPRLSDIRRCSFPSIGSDPFTGASGCVKGAKFKLEDCGFDFRLKRSDIARLRPPPSFDEEPGLLIIGVLGDFDSEAGVGVDVSLPAEGGGVADVRIVKGG